MKEDLAQFANRKRDHVQWALSREAQALELAHWDFIQLDHEAFPDLNLSDVTLEVQSLGKKFSAPFFVSSMTAGHVDSLAINQNLAKASAQRGWLMGVGSQRRELSDPAAATEWEKVRATAPNVRLGANIGLAQVITESVASIQGLVDRLGAEVLFVHLNSLQEALQPEGTPQFRGGLVSLKKLTERVNVPVVVKETGCGFSESSIRRLVGSGIVALDLAGGGGTHWGRVEGLRAPEGHPSQEMARTFRNWGFSTIESLEETLIAGEQVDLDFEIWASGGVRSGLDAAKLLAMGALMVGGAAPFLEAAKVSSESVEKLMGRWEQELRIALFCTGSREPREIGGKFREVRYRR